MQDTFMSDSEDEGGEVECPIQQQQQYRYMNSEAGTLQRARPLDDTVADGHRWPSNNDSKTHTIERQPLDIGFLVSFVVDARGGAMKAKRRGGVRIIVPPAACAAPTRVTCRAATRRAPAAAPPPLMEGEALASRLLELQPQGAKFLAPVIIEVPIFTASCPEREIVILRSDTGDTWQDHYLHNNDNAMIQEVLSRERAEFGNSGEAIGENGERVTRVVTCDFPHYLAVVSRVRQEVHAIGPDGGTVSSAHIPQVQAQFPAQALTKRIRVGLQAHGARAELVRRYLPRRAAVSPVITVEPRRRKFHRSITLTAPLPHHPDDKVNTHDKASTANLRLLCSIMGGQARAVWEDVTGSTPLTLAGDCASFTTTVSARFWLMNCQNVSDATKLATDLYREMLVVPFSVRIVVLGKRLDALEGRLLVLYITDRYAYDTLLQQEHYSEVAHSTAVVLSDGKPVYLEFSGNLVPVTKSGTQPNFTFEAFKDNRVEFTVRVKHHEESPAGRIYFMNEPKVAKGEPALSPTCVLDVSLPAAVAPAPARSHADCLHLDQSGFDALKDELSFHWGDHNNSLGPASIHDDTPKLNGHAKTITNGDAKYTKDDSDSDTKPQVNGNAVHVDSNKTKATFDSDEDKTPMNTLEKGKKKNEGGFLGGLADKVKNVFSHSEDKDESKESSPKPQPKPRESKDKSPPKPAPRVINEDLLEKVDDMFKDLKTKPLQKDVDEVDNVIYSTKLVVDEDLPHDLKLKTDEVYHQYEHMQPVDTPLHCKTTDPFQFYTGCCDGRYKPGEKHRHDETSTLADRIEQVQFATNEKIQAVTDRDQGDVKDGLDKLGKEKDNVKQKTSDFKDEIIEKTTQIKNDVNKKGEEVKTNLKESVKNVKEGVNEKIDDVSQKTENLKDDFSNKAAEINSHVASEIDNLRASAEKTINSLTENVDYARSDAKNRINELDFAARERAEDLKIYGNEKLGQIEGSLQNASTALKDKTQAGIDTVTEKVQKTEKELNSKQAELSSKAAEIKSGAEEQVSEVIKTAENTVNDIGKSLDSAKDKSKSKGKKKSKEGKNFLSELVHNIFGEKDKIEGEIKEKISEGKDAANKVVDEASTLKNNAEASAAKKIEDVKGGAEQIVHDVTTESEKLVNDAKSKTDEVKKAAKDTKDNLQESISNKKDEIVSDIKDATTQMSQAIVDTKDSAADAVNKKKVEILETKDTIINEADDRLQQIKQEAEQTTDEIKRAAEETLNAAVNKKDEIQINVTDKINDLKESGKKELSNIQKAAADKGDEIQQSVKHSFDEVQETSSSAFDKLESAAKDKVKDATDTWEDLQSSTRDTFADFRDDVHGLENSAQDTLHSFQSSAGNTFDSLDDSAREFIGGVQTTGDNVKQETKELFGNAKDSFEGFQVTAGDKLEDVKQATDERLKQAGERLEEARQGVVEEARQTEGAVAGALADEADKFASNLNDLGNTVFGKSGTGLLKDSSTKLLESEKSQSSPHKKGSGIPKLKRKNKK
ncbi:interaptin-like isoform X2 [Aricia agestis]|nr:interaptin-like isoform X2 [Aricia agestis]